MSEIAIVDRPQRREITQVIDSVPIMDTARFEHFQRIANVLARSSMIPETLRTIGKANDKEDLPFEQILSNCFLVVNQAARWGFDPFSVISCCAVIHGRLSYEGKLVAAVLDAKLDIQLHYHFIGEPTTDACRVYVLDQPFTDETIAQLKPGASVPGLRLWDGSVGEWKTTGTGTPWTQKNYKRMLIYRGARDWTRIYEPAIMLGVYTEDELLDLAEDARARRAAPVVSLSERLALARPTGETNGFSQEHVKQELGASQPEAQREAGDKPLPPASTGDEPKASEKESGSPDSGATDQPRGVLRSPQSNASASADAGEADTGTASPASPSNSSREVQPPSLEPETKPAPELSPAVSGAGATSSPTATSGMALVDEPKQAGGGGNSPVSNVTGLPEGWERQYADALKKALKFSTLPKHAFDFWKPLGGWDAHKDGPNGETAVAIYRAFERYFPDHEKRDAILREIGASQ